MSGRLVLGRREMRQWMAGSVRLLRQWQKHLHQLSIDPGLLDTEESDADGSIMSIALRQEILQLIGHTDQNTVTGKRVRLSGVVVPPGHHHMLANPDTA